MKSSRYVVLFIVFSINAFFILPSHGDKPQLSLKSQTSHEPRQTSCTMSMEDLKASNAIDLKVSQFRLIETLGRITQTFVQDPVVAETFVLAENVVAVVGKNPGNTNIGLTCESGIVAVDVQVTPTSGSKGLKPAQAERSACYLTNDLKASDGIDLKVSHCCYVRTRFRQIKSVSFDKQDVSKAGPVLDSPLARVQMIDPGAGEIVVLGACRKSHTERFFTTKM